MAAGTLIFVLLGSGIEQEWAKPRPTTDNISMSNQGVKNPVTISDKISRDDQYDVTVLKF